MKTIYVHNIVQDKTTENLVNVNLDLELYCNKMVTRLFNVINRYENITGMKFKDDEILHSNLFDVIGMIKRLPKNIVIGGESNEGL
jgi:transcriptional antiterminator